jgi:tetratricopeptide (TPR) repeat protein
MANEQAKHVLQQGIAAARAGQQAQARQLLQEAVRRDPRSEAAWLWLSSVAKDNQERIFCLKQLLAINPNNENAIKGLRQLGVATEQAATQTPATVPIVDSRRLDAVTPQLESILQNYQPVPTRTLPFEWTKKKRGRVGDSSAALLRLGAIVGVLIVLAAFVGAGVLLLRGQNVALFATPTPLPTNTPSATPTPGLTNTPTPTPRASYTPSFTPPPDILSGNLATFEPTAMYPVVIGNTVINARALIDSGKFDEGIALMERERQAYLTSKGPDYESVVYYMALAYADAGNTDRAMAVLAENQFDSPAYHAAIGYVSFKEQDYAQALTESELAFRNDPKLVTAALTIAQVYARRREFPDALRALNLALETAPYNAVLLVARGETYLAAANVNAAYNDAALALYIDPRDEEAYILRSRALLAQAARSTDPEERTRIYGMAVVATQEFKFYFPGETIAWLLLGQARLGEGNVNAALDALTQAVVVDQKSPAAQEVFLTRGRLYLSQRRYTNAFDDFDKANAISSTVDGHTGRLQAALALANFGAASDDVNTLLRSDPANTGLLLTRVDLLIRDQNYRGAEAILTDTFVNGLTGDDRATAQLYRGIVYFQSQTYDKALENLNASLAQRESGTGHYYRGQTLEALRRYEEAVADYQWLTFWNQVYEYDFIADVQARLDRIVPILTPTVMPSPTVRPSPTPIPSRTPTPVPTDTPTRTPTLEPTSTPTKSETPTRTESPTRTPTITRSPTSTRTPTITPTPTSTLTPSITLTPVASDTPTVEPTQKDTPAP